MHVVWQDDDGIDLKRSLAPCQPKGLAKSIYVTDEPVAPTVRERNRKK